MALWLILLIAGVVLVVLGFAGVPGFMILGIIALVVGITLVVVGRGNETVGRPRR
ncbi:hypothetical protein [Luteimicrobium subarcticum]|uniref:Uncharacterized protein n=1 Tax=Luteimicrobium subarcticum TaxID=620910 RepID=A0A2M8WR30_9MICO|nr:hypothetical protein [Luteimicrobium subarcticum]PJI93381.1 hypothetical protein CLV34_1950 [Luteimicrobium subarcticum]